MNGADLIAAERERQRTAEGYTAEHDAGHAEELAQAGAAYALNGYFRQRMPDREVTQNPGFAWPWGAEYWKPTPGDRIRELVKAGALIAAAIDSLRAEPSREAERPPRCADCGTSSDYDCGGWGHTDLRAEPSREAEGRDHDDD